MRCHGCGADRDPHGLAHYPHQDDALTADRPVPQLLCVECCDDHEGDRMARVCHDCFHRLQPDMWIERRCWEALNPTTPLEQLPFVQHDRDGGLIEDAARY